MYKININIRWDTFGKRTKCPSLRDVHLIESQIKGVKKGFTEVTVV